MIFPSFFDFYEKHVYILIIANSLTGAYIFSNIKLVK